MGIRTMQLRLRMHHDLLVTRLVPTTQKASLGNIIIPREVFQPARISLAKSLVFLKLTPRERDGGSLKFTVFLFFALTECNNFMVIICFLRDQVHSMMTLTDYDGLQKRRHRVLQRRVFYSKVCTHLSVTCIELDY